MLGNANLRGIFQTRVHGFDALQNRVPGFMSVRWAAGTVQLVVTCDKLSEADRLASRGLQAMQRSAVIWIMEVS